MENKICRAKKLPKRERVRKTPKVRSGNFDKFLPAMKIRKKAISSAIEKCRKILDAKQSGKSIKHAFSGEIETLAVFSYYLTLYPEDIREIRHPEMLESIKALLEEKKKKLKYENYGKYLLHWLESTNSTTETQIKMFDPNYNPR
ncbi:MAG: hypothetical protein Q7S21_01075 [archaeon]|nr:hypothetical protein [archaeon]